jgi:uncharacterized alpha/beta hydrolase family protein
MSTSWLRSQKQNLKHILDYLLDNYKVKVCNRISL